MLAAVRKQLRDYPGLVEAGERERIEELSASLEKARAGLIAI